VSLVGACVPSPVPVSTASVRQARRSTKGLLETVLLRWAVPAGAVYLLQFADTEDPAQGEDHSGDGGISGEEDGAAAVRAGVWARSVHGTALGPGQHPGGGRAVAGPGSTGTDRTSTAGFGVVLTGRWNPPPG
jgi:hypothetical protein